ncbi:prohead protease/major capsid protein fusion protein [Rhizobium sp. 11_C7_N12_5]|uniref:prohead protease/major capsid protein fusion protein n=1 Tax=Rhizobium sp. 11_C7_N12_5 TaxID=3240770 RepID=UPI003F220A32
MSNALRKTKVDSELRRVGGFRSETLNAEDRTVWAVAATETPVRRAFGDEVLRCAKTAVIADRLQGLPVIDSHNSFSVLSILGQVVESRFEGRNLLVKIAFANNERGDAAFALVRDGMLHKVSVGYRIHKIEESTSRDGAPLVTVTRWEPMELSLVSVPADPNATIRGKIKMAKKPATTRSSVQRVHNEILEDDIEAGHEHDDDGHENAGQRSFSVDGMRSIIEMRNYAARSGISDGDFDKIMSRSNGSIDVLRASLFERLAERDLSTSVDSRMSLDQFSGQGHRANEAETAVIDALAARLGAKPSMQTNPLAGRSTVEIGRHWLEERGVSTRGMDDVRIADTLISGRSIGGFSGRGIHTTSDFPMLLQAAGNRALLQRYEPLTSPLKALSTKRNARDFRQQSFIRPGEAPKLKKVLESGEITAGSLNEDSRGLKVETYARLFNISRNALVNDDLGAFIDFLGAFAQSAAETEGDLFASLLTANDHKGMTLSDDLPLFHASRNNLASAGSAITIDALSDARKAMRLHKNVNGTGTAGVVPAVLLVGPEKETEAEKIVTQINATNQSEANPFAGKLRVMVENRFEGPGWYLFADPTTRPALMHGYLQDFEGPQLESKEGWDVLGTSFRCILDFGCGVFEWRAAYFNPGVK